jgi:hypothetical protein
VEAGHRLPDPTVVRVSGRRPLVDRRALAAVAVLAGLSLVALPLGAAGTDAPGEIRRLGPHEVLDADSGFGLWGTGGLCWRAARATGPQGHGLGVRPPGAARRRHRPVGVRATAPTTAAAWPARCWWPTPERAPRPWSRASARAAGSAATSTAGWRRARGGGPGTAGGAAWRRPPGTRTGSVCGAVSAAAPRTARPSRSGAPGRRAARRGGRALRRGRARGGDDRARPLNRPRPRTAWPVPATASVSGCRDAPGRPVVSLVWAPRAHRRRLPERDRAGVPARETVTALPRRCRFRTA